MARLTSSLTPVVDRPRIFPLFVRAFTLGAAFSLGALSVGAGAIGVLAIGRLAIGKSQIHHLVIEDLEVRRLRVQDLEVERGFPGQYPPAAKESRAGR